ncbi:MAG: 1-deoxy-D-xylulose-5-phosphate synthase [Spirochaetaceae bacterium]|nr:1-deoxy-D-xylulose-5-phosphate synthase [Spirochaetaceae bacterium]
MLLNDISSPKDIKNLSYEELDNLASQIRERIIQVVGSNGGHLSSNLGVVELTIALHRIFDSPDDALIWDVSHQSYTHKILTGRNDKLDTIRMKDGISGFTKRSESVHDWFDAGHASTSISSALGLLQGRQLLDKPGKVVAIIGDGALTGGMAFEALSHAGQISKNLIIILNDNNMSISKNTGSISKYLSRLSTTPNYQKIRLSIDRFFERLPFSSRFLRKLVFRLKRGLKGIFFHNNLFVDFGFEYVGPLNGHNIEEMEKVFSKIKKINRPVVVHVITQKGKGYSPAENDPTTFHGIGPFCISDGTAEKYDKLSFTEVFSEEIIELGATDERIAAITAAMVKGTGLTKFAHRFPDRFFDTGIAEEHAVTFAGGLARAGMMPVVAIYSTFMQRSVDQLIHDIALQKVPSVFVLDRSGAVPDDGETHQGIFDISLLRPVPGVTLLAPASAEELKLFLRWGVSQQLPVIIRYPKASCPAEEEAFSEPVVCGRGVLIENPLKKCGQERIKRLFVCTGGIYPEVKEAVDVLQKREIPVDIYNLRFLKPLDKQYFIDIASRYDHIVFVEDGIRIGGIGTYLESLLQRSLEGKKTAVCGFPDRFLAQGKRSDILEEAHLSPSHLARKMLSL